MLTNDCVFFCSLIMFDYDYVDGQIQSLRREWEIDFHSKQSGRHKDEIDQLKTAHTSMVEGLKAQIADLKTKLTAQTKRRYMRVHAKSGQFYFWPISFFRLIHLVLPFLYRFILNVVISLILPLMP